MPSTGLDISDKSVRFLSFAEKNGVFTIGRYSEESIKPGIVEAGKIKDEERMKEVLSELKRKNDLDFIRVSLPEEQAYLFPMNIPLVGKKEIRDNISFQLEEHIPLGVSEVVFDYEIMNERSDGYALQVSAVSSELVESYARIFTESGLLPVSFEVEAQAISRAAVRDGDPSTAIVVDFGHTRTGISVVSGGVVVFTSTIEIGGWKLTDAFAEDFSVDKAEAEKIKRSRGLEASGDDGKKPRRVTAVIAALREEINKRFLYWHSRKEPINTPPKPIEKIILCGGESNLRGFSDYLARSMRISVELASVWANAPFPEHYIPEIPFNDSLAYATAIGLALADVKHG